MRLYFSTTEQQAHQILNQGFVDVYSVGFEGGGSLSGVPLSDDRLGVDEGRLGDEHLQVVIADDLIAEYELVAEEPMPDGSRHAGLGHREWIVPAAILNEHASVALADEDEETEFS